MGIAAATCGLGLAFALGCSWNSDERKQRAWRRFLGYAAKPDEVVESFVEYIRAESPTNLKSFQDRRRADPEAAMAEAIVFGMLQQLRLNPTIADEPGIGGGDFLCKYRPIIFGDNGSWPLIVEATTLEPTAVERNSGWRNEVPDAITGGPFSMITERITARASSKVRQLSRHEMPRVLAIVSSHIGADALLSSILAAESVLVSDRKISQPIGGGKASVITDLAASAFLKGDPASGKISARRPTISAVLLTSVAGDRSSVLGILHPEPRYPLDISAFPEIPFVRIRRWPIENGAIELDWVVGQPSGRHFKHQMIRYKGDAFSRALEAAREKRKSAEAGSIRHLSM
jgi:hypothetical protein